MTASHIATEIFSNSDTPQGADLLENQRALAYAREQHEHWSWYARWRGGGPEFRAHCQDQAAFFGGWVTRLERCRDSMLSKLAAVDVPAYPYLN